MSNPNGLLTRNMSPEQARLLDQQLRDKQFQGQQYGGRTGGFMTAASGAIQGAAKAGQGLSGMLTGKRFVGANEQEAVQAQNQLQAMSDALVKAEGNTQSERLLNAAEKLEKLGTQQAVLKAMQLREQAAALGVQEEKLELQRQQTKLQGERVSIAQTEAENRKIQLEQEKAQQIAANDLAQQRIDASTTTQQVVIDSEGNRFNMITKESGGVTYAPLGEVKAPVGDAKTVNELTVDKQIKARNDLQFNKEFLTYRKEAVAASSDTTKVFTSADTAYNLLKELEGEGGTTGGIVAETERKIKRYLGIADETSVPAELLKKELGMAIAANLKATFGGSQITDSERKFLEANMISIEDTMPVILRKLEASMEVAKGGMEKLSRLTSAKGYTDFVAIQNEYIEKDYLDVQEKYELNFGSVGRANSLEQMTPDQIAAKQAIERRQAEKTRQSRRGFGAR
jgi:hypothetical protein